MLMVSKNASKIFLPHINFHSVLSTEVVNFTQEAKFCNVLLQGKYLGKIMRYIKKLFYFVLIYIIGYL